MEQKEWLDSLEPMETGKHPAFDAKFLRKIYVTAPSAEGAVAKVRRRKAWARTAGELAEVFGDGATCWGFYWELLVPSDIEGLNFRNHSGLPFGQKGDWRVRLEFRDTDMPNKAYAFGCVKDAGVGKCAPTRASDLNGFLIDERLYLTLVFEAKTPGRRRDVRPWREHFRKVLMPQARIGNARFRVRLWVSESVR